MSERLVPIRLTRAAALLVVGALLAACSLPFPLPGAGSPQTVGVSPTPTPTRTPETGIQGPASTVSPLAECPEFDTWATLTFDHNIEWGVPGTGQFGVATKGSYQINIVKTDVTYGPNARAGVYNLSGGPFPVTVSLKGFKDCSDGQSETVMNAVVTGTCSNGMLMLNIEEVYEPTSVTILCNEDKDEVDIPVPISALMAPITWSIPISQLSAGGAEKQVPFMGQGGNGVFTYRLTLP
jgi:hypothetical protein